jgi:hypothetical protein
VIGLSVIGLTLLGDVESTCLTSKCENEPISYEADWGAISSRLHLFLLINGHIGVDLETVTQNLWLPLGVPETTDDEDVCIGSLGRGSLEGNVVLVLGPLELLLAEALELEVKEENLR